MYKVIKYQKPYNSKMTTIRIDENVKKQLNKISVNKFRMTYTDISKNFLLNHILKEYIENNSISNDI